MSSFLPVAICATSTSCWHCGELRKNLTPVGQALPESNPKLRFGGGNWEWSAPLFRRLLLGVSEASAADARGAASGKNKNWPQGAKAQVLVIHFESHQSVLDIHEYLLDSSSETGVVRREGPIPIPLVSEMNKFIPMFPGWFFVDGTVWFEALSRKQRLFAVVPSFETIVSENDEKISVVRIEDSKLGEDPSFAFLKFIACPQTCASNGKTFINLHNSSLYSHETLAKLVSKDGFSFIPSGRMTEKRDLIRRFR
jgi:hypothetical protein